MRAVNRLKTSAQLLALFAFCLGLHLCGTWILPLVDRDEPRFAEAAREMRARGDWLVPTFNGAPRYDKPPLTYWLQIAAFRVFGETDFAARFHAPLCAALTALVVFGFCSRLHDRRAAWCGALAFSLCAQVAMQGRAAVADLPLVLGVTSAAWAGWELCQSPRRLWWWAFHGALACGFLAKGPVAFLPVIWILTYAKLAGIGNLNSRFLFGRGALLVTLLIGAWAGPALIKTHGDFFYVGIGRHVIARSFAPLEGHGGRGVLRYFALLPFYFATVFASFFPWSIALPRAWKERSDRDLFLLSGIGTTFLIFTLLATKLPHYTLPAFPLLACLVAPQLAKNRTRFSVTAALVVVVELTATLIGFPKVAPLFPTKTLAEKMRAELRPETALATVDFFEPSLVWYFRARTKSWLALIPNAEMTVYLQEPGTRICVSSQPMPSPFAQASGFNLATGKRVTLSAVVSDSRPASLK